MINHTTVTIIGAGQAGLAMSRRLTQRSIDHVLLERGAVANSWKTERWDSLRLLTPNWMTRLPDHRYTGNDPDGYMTAGEVATFLSDYRSSIDAPVETDTAVHAVTKTDDRYLIQTSRGAITSDAVVVASGASSTPRIPKLALDIPSRITQLTPNAYKNPGQLGRGRVLVVGASASGAQLADEIQRSGREVTLAVGDHVRLPRTYRGMDIHWWMESLGRLTEQYDEVEDIARARRLPSLQLVGSLDKRTLDLNALHANGVSLVGRLVGVCGTTAQFSGSFANQCASADLKLGRLLTAVDEYAAVNGLDAEIGDIDRPKPTTVPPAATGIDLRNIESIIWATGFRPNYPWLEPHLLDRKGVIVHDGGVMSQPGMYVLGLPFTRRRNSSFIDGVGADATDLSAHLAQYLDARASSYR